jgi:hypothetical protein
MGQISQFLRRFDKGIAHWCPGCKELHLIHLTEKNWIGAKWEWDGNLVQPSIKPSVHIIVRDPDGEIKDEVCHYHLRNGQLEFVNDCTHELKGVTMPLPPLPEHYRDQCLNF